MADAKPQTEPSMEEILASIRRIISEDAPAEGEGEPEAAPAKAAEPAPKPAPKPASPAPKPVAAARAPEPEPEDEDVLDLTDKVGDNGTVVSLNAAKAVPPPSAPVEEEIELQDRGEPEAEPPPAPPTPPTPPVEATATDLMSAATAAAATGSFAALARSVDSQPAGFPLSVGGRTLEDIVKEMVRPMIREWLDANLPGLVERLVRREIERIAHNGQDQ